jgi:hypothetical protein
MAEETQMPPASLDGERDRVRRDVLPPWAPAGAPPDLIDEVPDVPGVLAHHDAGAWNMTTDGAQFTVLDWESSAAPALPLWDLAYFLADALVQVDGLEDLDARVDGTLALFRGDHRSSPVLWQWMERAVERLAIPRSAVGPLVTLGFLHHGLSLARRGALLEVHADGAVPAETGPLVRLAEPWLRDPRLGPRWAAWQ